MSANKPKKDPLREAADAISKLDAKYHPTTEADLQEFLKTMKIGLRADAGVIGTVEEEESYAKLMSGEVTSLADKTQVNTADLGLNAMEEDGEHGQKAALTGDELSALLLNSPAISAHMILAGGYSVVVCSYEFVEASSKKKRYEDAIELWSKVEDRDAPKPKQPTTALASGLWALTGLYIKRGYMDEVQVVNKRDGERHKALKQLPVLSWCMMSGTLAHNRWHDLSRYMDFLKGHVYTTDEKFLTQFSSPGYGGSSSMEINGAQMMLLQRFLQAFTVMRPRNVLRLPPCTRVAYPLRLTESQEFNVHEMTLLYRQCCGMDTATGTAETSPLGMALRAQLHALHPRLAPPGKKIKFEPDQEDLENSTAAELNQKHTVADPNAAEKRRKWLNDLSDWSPEMFDESPHVQNLSGFIAYMVKDHPEHKLVVMSQYLKYLDILDLVMKRRYNIQCLRYDGTVGQTTRVEVQKNFSKHGSPRPLLMTAGAGSVGLNLTAGKVIVLAEEWWNYSIEAQAISRC